MRAGVQAGAAGVVFDQAADHAGREGAEHSRTWEFGSAELHARVEAGGVCVEGGEDVMTGSLGWMCGRRPAAER